MKLFEIFEARKEVLLPKDWDLEQQAKYVENDNQNELAKDFIWHFDPEFPIDKIDSPGVDWMKDEIKWKEEEGYKNYYENMFSSSIKEPIVIHLDENGFGHIWDGYHRVGACQMQNIKTIPAIVGVRKK